MGASSFSTSWYQTNTVIAKSGSPEQQSFVYSQISESCLTCHQFMIFSAACAAAQTPHQLIAFRAIGGIGGLSCLHASVLPLNSCAAAAIIPAGFGVIGNVSPFSSRNGNSSEHRSFHRCAGPTFGRWSSRRTQAANPLGAGSVPFSEVCRRNLRRCGGGQLFWPFFAVLG